MKGRVTMKYTITLEVESTSDPREWVFPDTLVIDEPYEVLSIDEKVSA